MKQKRIKLEELMPAFGDVSQSGHFHNDDLIEKIKTRGWEEIKPIPVVEISEHLRQMVSGKKYHFIDGNHRDDAADVIGEEYIDSIVFSGDDDLQEISKLTGNGYLAKEFTTEEFFYNNIANQSKGCELK